MLASLRSAALFGLDAIPVDVEVDVTFGLPSLVLVGLPDASVRESRDRSGSPLGLPLLPLSRPPSLVATVLMPATSGEDGA